jgi:hypothetical protein
MVEKATSDEVPPRTIAHPSVGGAEQTGSSGGGMGGGIGGGSGATGEQPKSGLSAMGSGTQGGGGEQEKASS